VLFAVLLPLPSVMVPVFHLIFVSHQEHKSVKGSTGGRPSEDLLIQLFLQMHCHLNKYTNKRISHDGAIWTAKLENTATQHQAHRMQSLAEGF
jgi:hypothetical protein